MRIAQKSHKIRFKYSTPTRYIIKIVNIFILEGLIETKTIIKFKNIFYLFIYLKYNRLGLPIMTQIEFKSTAGRRYFWKFFFIFSKIKRNKSSIFFLNTSKGLLTNNTILSKKSGGEVILKII